MKYDRWTLALTAAGLVTVPSVLWAQEQKTTALAGVLPTSISGYVDTSVQWNFGTGNENNPPYKFGGPDKADGFNLNVVQISIAKPLDESEWASGYHVDLWFGPDANKLGTVSTLHTISDTGAPSADVAIRQAYVALRTPLGNGIDWKIGVFESIIGYESVASPDNPNYTRSYGHSIEPQTHTGILAAYRINDCVKIAAGVADTIGPVINARAFEDSNGFESSKTYMGSISLTAPSDWGAFAGSTLYGGVVNGFQQTESAGDFDENTTSYYVGATLATPVAGLRVGGAFDYLDVHRWGVNVGNPSVNKGTVWAASLYGSYQASEKLSFHLRGEYLDDEANLFDRSGENNTAFSNSQGKFKVWAFTATAQYDLWQNVTSRVEFRCDHSCDGKSFGRNTDSFIARGSFNSGSPSRENAFMLALNVIYKF